MVAETGGGATEGVPLTLTEVMLGTSSSIQPASQVRRLIPVNWFKSSLVRC